jgi:hypothetical protein
MVRHGEACCKCGDNSLPILLTRANDTKLWFRSARVHSTIRKLARPTRFERVTCCSAPDLTPDRLRRLTPRSADDALERSSECSSLVRSMLEADGGQSSALVYMQARKGFFGQPAMRLILCRLPYFHCQAEEFELRYDQRRRGLGASSSIRDAPVGRLWTDQFSGSHR